MSEIIKQTEYYTLKRVDGAFVAELNSEALSGVSGLANIELHDTSELMLNIRVTRVVNEALCPTDVVLRRVVANQRHIHQQELFKNKS